MRYDKEMSSEEAEALVAAFSEQEGLCINRTRETIDALRTAYAAIPVEERAPLIHTMEASFNELGAKSIDDPFPVSVARETTLAQVFANYPQFGQSLYAFVPLQEYHYTGTIGFGARIYLRRDDYKGLPYLYWARAARPVLGSTRNSNP